jgi:AcrR family transcriptional regulator
MNNMSYHSFLILAYMAHPSRKADTALTPRKKPIQARSAATVQAILEAAAHILETDGLAACSTNAVALRAGVSIGSLYQYFPSRDAITKALILEQTEAVLKQVESIDPHKGGQAALLDLVDVAITQQLKRPILARVLDIEEQRLLLASDLENYAPRLSRAVQTLLGQTDLPPDAHQPEVVFDLLAIIRGMVDAAGRRGESDIASLRKRVERAAFGYLYASTLGRPRYAPI